jgi:hypothetical protein
MSKNVINPLLLAQVSSSLRSHLLPHSILSTCLA